MEARDKSTSPRSRLKPRVLTILILAAFLSLGADGRRTGEMTGRPVSDASDREAVQWSDPPLRSQDFFDGLPGVLADVAADTLAEAIRYSRDRALTSSRPIPDRVRRALVPYFDPLLLDRVRYTTDWSVSANGTLQRLIMMNDHVQAITLDDVIVFRDRRSADDLFLWSHELKHVEQYQRWGIPRFARLYLLDHRQVEREADEHAVHVYRKLLEKHYNLPPAERPKPP
ncbi:MAG: DUF4157 domain-containing protein [Syntrophobacteraceae bacterium]|jgi:hypothetical protein|nr:DUF4157 domain-containing protein [Syntrophobacteraceae bacterium]